MPRMQAGGGAPAAQGVRDPDLPSQPSCHAARAGFPQILAQVHQTWGWTLLLPAPPGCGETVAGVAQGFLVSRGMLLNGLWTITLRWAAVWL